MKITKREKVLLYMLLENDVHRYLLANTYGRLDGSEKAERHLKISEIVFSFIFQKKYMYGRDHDFIMRIHNSLAEILTDRLDEVIGFPIKEESWNIDYFDYCKRFVNVIIDNMDKIKDNANNPQYDW